MFLTLGYPLPVLNLFRLMEIVTTLWSELTGGAEYVVSVTWWYKLADTRAKSILDADVPLSQENSVSFGF